MLKGTWVYQLDGQPPVTLKAGEALFIPYGAVHSAKNVGSETGIELATHVIEKGKPLLSLADGGAEMRRRRTPTRPGSPGFSTPLGPIARTPPFRTQPRNTPVLQRMMRHALPSPAILF